MRRRRFTWVLAVTAFCVAAAIVILSDDAGGARVGPVLDSDPQCFVAVDNGDGRMLPVRCSP